MTFRKIALPALVAFAIAAFAGFTATDAMAQASATDSANVNALISNPITLSNVSGLDFGEISPSFAATSLTVAADAAGTTSGDAVEVGASAASAEFTVGGLSLRSYDITLPLDGTIVLTDGGAGADMAVDGFTHSAGGTPALGAGGSATFYVGGTLSVGADQLAGSYSSTFDVTVDYQ